MSLSHRYSNFTALTVNSDAPQELRLNQVEDEKLQSFEQGYKAGWEDAVKAHETAKDKIAADFSQNLQDMSFTFHEAFSKLGTAMEPLLSQIVSKVLPELADKTLAAHVVTEMTKLMADEATCAIEIAVSPTNLLGLSEILDDATDIPFVVTGEPALGDGQVYLRVNAKEREINIAVVTQGITNALDAFFEQLKQDNGND